MNTLTALFWLSLGFLAYTFVGYPVLLVLISRFRSRPHRRAQITPRVSIIIAAHNAEALIEEKIRNTLQLRYPEDKREVLVASDGSTDRTAELAAGFAPRGVRLVHIPERRGKHYAQRIAAGMSTGDVLVFTDVAVRLDPDAIEQIVSNFADPEVGCVSSEDRVSAPSRSWMGEWRFLQFDAWLRRLESRVASLVGVSGSFFALRHEVCSRWHDDQSSDFFVALHAVAQGYRAVVDPRAVGHYELVRKDRAEFQRKVRTIVHGLDVFFSHLELLDPMRYGLFALELLSHKLFRWLVPFVVMGLLGFSVALWNAGVLYRASAVLLLSVGGLSLAASLLSRWGDLRALRLASFIVIGAGASLVAWAKFMSGETFVTWEPTRRA